MTAAASPTTTISSHFTHTFEDYLTLVHARRETARFGRRSRYALWLAMFLAFLLFANPELRDPGAWSLQLAAIVVGGGALIMIAVMVAIDFIFDRLIYRAHYARLATAGQVVQYEIAEDGLLWAMPQGNGKLAWSAVSRIVSMPQAVVLFVSRIEGLVVPARGFSSPAAYAEAVTMMRRRIAPDRQS